MGMGILGPSVENQAAYANAQITFHAQFFSDLESLKPDPLEEMCQELPSNTAKESHIFIGDVPGFKEWVGPREMGSLQAHNIDIANRDWSSGIPIHRNQIADDKLGLVYPAIMRLAKKAARHRAQLIVENLLNGFAGNVNLGKGADAAATIGSGLTYDGSFLFATNHALEGGPGQSNLLANTALSDASLEAALELMDAFTTYDGLDPLEVEATHLIVGPKLRFMAERLLKQKLRVRYPDDRGGTNTQSGADTNIHENRLKLIVSKRIKDYTPVGGADYSKYWFVAALDEPIKPFIFQNREPITTTAQTGWETPSMFEEGVMKFGAQARYAVAPYDWRTVVGSQGA